jgi:hypothetical protein
MKKLLLIGSTFFFLLFNNAKAQSPPAYDLCCEAISIIIQHSGVCVGEVDYTNTDATHSTVGLIPLPTCGNFTDSTTPDVWITFTSANSFAHTIKVDSGSAPSAQDLAMAVYTSSGNCSGSFTLVGCDDNSNNIMPMMTITPPSAGIIYYVRLWSNNGTPSGNFRFCITGSTVGIDELTNENSFAIFPNPTANSFIIKLNSELKDARVEIYNVPGEKVYSTAINGKQQTINNKFPSGVYFVKVSNGEKQFVEKLIVQ